MNGAPPWRTGGGWLKRDNTGFWQTVDAAWGCVAMSLGKFVEGIQPKKTSKVSKAEIQSLFF